MVLNYHPRYRFGGIKLLQNSKYKSEKGLFIAGGESGGNADYKGEFFYNIVLVNTNVLEASNNGVFKKVYHFYLFMYFR